MIIPEEKLIGTLKIFRRDEPVFVNAGERPTKEPKVLIGECLIYKNVQGRLKIGDWHLGELSAPTIAGDHRQPSKLQFLDDNFLLPKLHQGRGSRNPIIITLTHPVWVIKGTEILPKLGHQSIL